MVRVGAMDLRTYIGRDRTKLSALAQALSVSETTVYRYISRTRMPRPETVRAIERETGGAVTPADFYAHAAAPAKVAA
jgi:DNA-binding transcriptional regulator YdaS (Cro superfamily)